MISWIKGKPVETWQTNNKFFVLINCHGLGYEVQILESTFIKLKTNQLSNENLTLWLKHIKKEDSDSFYGFISKDQKDFFIEILNIKGIGAQIGMTLLNKFSINQVIDAIKNNDRKLLSSVPGIGQKMTDRIILELKSKLYISLNENEKPKDDSLQVNDIKMISIIQDLDLTLQSLNYSKSEIKKVLPIIINNSENKSDQITDEKNLTFEKLLKLAMNYLDKENSNLDL